MLQRMGSMGSATSVVVKRPMEEVWMFLTDPLNLPRWSPAWLGAHVTSSGPMGPGSTFEGQRSLLGLRIRWSGVITEWDPPHALAFSVQVLGARSGVRVTLEPTTSGTKATKVYEREPRPVQKLASRIFGPWLRRSHDARNEQFTDLLKTAFGG